MTAHAQSQSHTTRQRLWLVCPSVLFGLMVAISIAIAGQTGDWGASELQLQNPDAQPRPFTITLFSPLGVNASSNADALTARGVRFYRPNVSNGFSGTVRVDGALALLGVVTLIFGR